jgi:hypothetical protein
MIDDGLLELRQASRLNELLEIRSQAYRVSSAKSLLPRYYVEPAHLEGSCFGRLHRPKAVFITTNADEADTPRLACALRRWLEKCDVDPDPLAPALWQAERDPALAAGRSQGRARAEEGQEESEVGGMNGMLAWPEERQGFERGREQERVE